MGQWGNFSFLIFFWGGARFSKEKKESHSTFKNNSSVEKWTFVCSWHIFFAVKLVALQLLMMFSVSQLMPTMHFSCLLEGTVVLLCKCVKFYFDLYRFKTKQNLFLYWENFISAFIFSFMFLLFFSCWSSIAAVCFCFAVLSLSDNLCSSSVIVFCSTNWVNSSTWAEVLCILLSLRVGEGSSCFYSILLSIPVRVCLTV